jgi:hypothetical protein
MSTAYKTIATASGTNSYTGSIAKLVAMGATKNTSSISRIEFGAMTFPEAGDENGSGSYTPSSVLTHRIDVGGNGVIDGPIGRFAMTSSHGEGSFLIYFDA